MIPPVTVLARKQGDAADTDLTCLVDSYSINHGRDDPDSQPEASSLTLDLSLDQVAPELPPVIEIGATITVRHILHPADSHTGPTQAIRFVGQVSDIAVGWDDAGTDTPDAGVVQVVAVSPMAGLGSRMVGDIPWPQELDGARAKRILDLAGANPPPAETDPGTVQVLARDVDRQPALNLVQEMCEYSRGVLWQTRDGKTLYADSDHRKGLAVALTLDACDVLVTPQWRRSTEGLVNKVSLAYGPTPEGGEQATYQAQNDPSIAVLGERSYSLTTQLAALADASALGGMLLARNSAPVWVMAELPVDVKNLGAADTETLMRLDMHSLLQLSGLPAIGTIPTQAYLWVEGWQEKGAWGDLELVLSVSGFCRTVPAPTWDRVDPGWVWNGMGEMTWDQATCMGPMPSFGRWSDIPASLRWNELAATITWDTWPY